MSVSIKVAVRCRPYTLDDKLGVHMVQLSKDEGEINLVNSSYSTKRFAFSWSWWSAYGWQRHQKGDEALAEDMKLIHQGLAYEATGVPIRTDVLEGNAVVMFAYGLSGSGKTFTTFGPDDPAVPEAWFKWAQPHDLWGIFPRLGYDLFQMCEQTWKFAMKYFQNVVDIVRDLMSPTGEEKNYKAGMRKDDDGFMDILWCIAANLKTWDDLRQTFMKSNARKAISPTQFNHQSTRGHCVMTLEVNKPKDDDPEMRQKGRIYVCDLAGTEPAGDIFYASYKKIKYPDGTIEHKLLGPHKDQRLTKNLQSQGKKINLSLSEMAQFFMKMAQAIKKKKLKPGKSIPGCNSYFLCKYLKDIMLQARTYLFCAIRPEAGYLNYTFSTLGFAKNASVIKLNPKKATTAATPGERKLMKQLEEMKAMMDELKKQNEALQASGGGGGGGGGDGGAAAAELQKKLEEQQAKEAELQKREEEAMQRAKELEARVKELEDGGGGGGGDGGGSGADPAEMAELKAQLAAQQADAAKLQEALAQQKEQNNAELAAAGIGASDIEAKRQMEEMLKKKAMEMNQMLDLEGGGQSAQNQALQQQKKEYGARGISLAELEKATKRPHFVNIDLDPFRSQRFLFFVKADGDTIFGKEGDVKPFTLQEPKQCVVTASDGKFTLTELAGENYHNGTPLEKGKSVPLANFDRVGMGSEVLLFRVPNEITDDMTEPDAGTIIKEVEEASRTDEQRALEEKMKQFELMKQQWEGKKQEQQLSEAEQQKQKEEMDKLAMELVNKEILDLLPKTKTAKKYCYELNRNSLSFEVSMQRGSEDNATPTVKVRVSKNDTKEIILIESFEFSKAASTLQDEHTRLKLALENDREYTSPEAHDPIRLFMDHTTTYGSAIIFPEYLQYQMDTDDEERYVAIKSAMALDQNVGKLELMWTPLIGPESETTVAEAEAFNDAKEELLGKPWTARLEIRGASGLEIMCSKAYVQYKFFGELFETLRIDDATFAPNFNYSYVHHIESVTQEFLDFLDKPMSFHVYAAPYIKVKDGEQPSTSDPVVVSRITGRALDTPAIDDMDEKVLRKHAKGMEKQIAEKDKTIRSQQEKISNLTQLLRERTEELEKLKGGSSKSGDIAGAKAADAAINGS